MIVFAFKKNNNWKMRKITNQEQYCELIRRMKENINLARNFSLNELNCDAAFWDETTRILNELGPPERTQKEWRKVWTDYKSFVKKKLLNNKREQSSTYGPPYKIIKLTANEEEVAEIFNMQQAISSELDESEILVDIKQEESLHGSSNGDMAHFSYPPENQILDNENGLCKDTSLDELQRYYQISKIRAVEAQEKAAQAQEKAAQAQEKAAQVQEKAAQAQKRTAILKEKLLLQKLKLLEKKN